MLSEGARAETKPNLMIYNDDVKCTHGSTVGRINDAHLFYFKTRGIPRKQAETLLAGGFAKSALKGIEPEGLREGLSRDLLERLK